MIKDFDLKSNLRIHKSENNKGLARSIIAGLDDIFNRYETAIIIEDDLEFSPYFLRFCLDGLSLYADVPQVASLHGYTPSLDIKMSQPYFLRGADCWGWATWKNRWIDFEENAEILINQISEQKLASKFDLDGAYPYFEMLKRQSRGEIDSWAIRWHASMFLRNKLTLYSNFSLVSNTGMDGSGTHYNQKSCKILRKVKPKIVGEPIKLLKQDIIESEEARESLKRILMKKIRRNIEAE